jgi:chromosome partitioning protein
MYKVYSIMIKKGGQAKSTTVATVARLCAFYGARVFVVDLAQPGTASTALRDSWPPTDHGTLADLIHPFCLLETSDHPHPDDVLSALEALKLPVPLTYKPSWGGGLIALLPFDEAVGGVARRLRSPFVLDGILRSIDSAFDLILVDAPAEDGVILDNVLLATDRALIPFVADAASLEGLDATLRYLRRGREEGQARATLGGIVLTRCEPRNKRVADIVNTLLHSGAVEGEQLQRKLLPFALRHSDFFDQAFRYGEPVWERTQDQRVWAGYVLLAEWFLVDAGLDRLIPNRRHAALIEDETKVLDTVAVGAGTGTGESRIRDFRPIRATTAEP